MENDPWIHQLVAGFVRTTAIDDALRERVTMAVKNDGDIKSSLILPSDRATDENPQSGCIIGEKRKIVLENEGGCFHLNFSTIIGIVPILMNR